MKDDNPATAAAAAPAGASENDAPSADAVADYLRQNPQFFIGRDALLVDMILPHASSGTISLVERQLSVLRDRNTDMRGRLNELVRTARVNHRIFERTLEITASIMEAADQADAARRLLEGLRSGFDVDAAMLHGIDAGSLAPELAEAMPVTGEARAREAVGNLLRPGRIICGLLRERELSFLFGDDAQRVASAAVMPIEVPGGMVLVALGSTDANHFTPDMGTLFIRFLGESLGRLLASPEAPAAGADDAPPTESE